MKVLQVKPQIHQFNNVQEFTDFFNVGAGDLILTHEFLYTPYLKEYSLPQIFCFKKTMVSVSRLMR